MSKSEQGQRSPSILPKEVVKVSNNSAGCLHLPALGSTKENPSPMCKSKLGNRKNNLIQKDIDIYPEGWRNWCGRCIDSFDNLGMTLDWIEEHGMEDK